MGAKRVKCVIWCQRAKNRQPRRLVLPEIQLFMIRRKEGEPGAGC